MLPIKQRETFIMILYLLSQNLVFVFTNHKLSTLMALFSVYTQYYCIFVFPNLWANSFCGISKQPFTLTTFPKCFSSHNMDYDRAIQTNSTISFCMTTAILVLMPLQKMHNCIRYVEHESGSKYAHTNVQKLISQIKLSDWRLFVLVLVLVEFVFLP